MAHIDGFVLPVAKKNLAVYRRLRGRNSRST